MKMTTPSLRTLSIKELSQSPIMPPFLKMAAMPEIQKIIRMLAM